MGFRSKVKRAARSVKKAVKSVVSVAKEAVAAVATIVAKVAEVALDLTLKVIEVAEKVVGWLEPIPIIGNIAKAVLKVHVSVALFSAGITTMVIAYSAEALGGEVSQAFMVASAMATMSGISTFLDMLSSPIGTVIMVVLSLIFPWVLLIVTLIVGVVFYASVKLAGKIIQDKIESVIEDDLPSLLRYMERMSNYFDDDFVLVYDALRAVTPGEVAMIEKLIEYVEAPDLTPSLEWIDRGYDDLAGETAEIVSRQVRRLAYSKLKKEIGAIAYG